MNSKGFKALLDTKAERVYIDFVPEGKTLPAVSFTHVGDASARILNGNKSGGWDTWRVMIIGKNRTQTNEIRDSLLLLDNTTSQHFKNIFVMAEGNIPARPEDATRTAFVDIKTYG